METKQPLVTRVTDEERKEYQKKLQEHNLRIQEACRKVGADFFSFRTDRDVFEAFSEMISRAIVWRT